MLAETPRLNSAANLRCDTAAGPGLIRALFTCMGDHALATGRDSLAASFDQGEQSPPSSLPVLSSALGAAAPAAEVGGSAPGTLGAPATAEEVGAVAAATLGAATVGMRLRSAAARVAATEGAALGAATEGAARVAAARVAATEGDALGAAAEGAALGSALGAAAEGAAMGAPGLCVVALQVQWQWYRIFFQLQSL